MLKFPYGLSNFENLITEGYYYVDRTDKIPLLENAGEQLLFLRPRRFGKSLLLSMLENYYDLAKADQFEKWFGHLKIGQNPTPKHNQYFVMKWDFSKVDPQGSVSEIKQALYDHLNSRIADCAQRYASWFTQEVKISANPSSSFDSLLSAISLVSRRLYLLIDEYDNFANEVLMSSQQPRQAHYETLLMGEGALKTVFKWVKAASAGQGLDKVFITGVSPVVLSDLTSGYNVAENIYLLREFNDLCGFREEEVKVILQQLVQECQLPETQVEEALSLMRSFYNGYSFTRDGTSLVYNPTLALYFFKRWQSDCQAPEELLDDNLAIDRNRLRYLSQLPAGRALIEQVAADSQPLLMNRLSSRFGLMEMLNPSPDQATLASLMYYLGILTLAGRGELNELQLRIPNLVIRQLYVERLYEMCWPAATESSSPAVAAKAFYTQGHLQPLCEWLEQRFKVFDNRDYRYSDELSVKMAFLLTLFNDRLYIMDSEACLDRRYADLSLIVRPDLRQLPIYDHLLEFKFVRIGKKENLTGEQIKEMSREELQALPVVQEKLAQARTQLAVYRQSLLALYGAKLRLQTHAVVAVGFERLVWERQEF